jgi:hypothetical protein
LIELNDIGLALAEAGVDLLAVSVEAQGVTVGSAEAPDYKLKADRHAPRPESDTSDRELFEARRQGVHRRRERLGLVRERLQEAFLRMARSDDQQSTSVRCED